MAVFVARYANAFLDVVMSAKLDTDSIDRELTDFLATWEGSVELRQFFANPSVSSIEKVAILDKLNVELKLQKELRNLLAVLINNDRIGQVDEVIEAYRASLNEQQGVQHVEIVTARALSEAESSELVAGIGQLAGASQKAGSRVEASFKLDASILGGAVVRVGSTVYDGSVRGRLERLKESLVQ